MPGAFLKEPSKSRTTRWGFHREVQDIKSLVKRIFTHFDGSEEIHILVGDENRTSATTSCITSNHRPVEQEDAANDSEQYPSIAK